MDASVAAFQRRLAEQYSKFQEAISHLLVALTGDHARANVAENIQRLASASGQLMDQVAESDRPQWLSEIHSLAMKAGNKSSADARYRLLRAIIRWHPEIKSINVVAAGQPLVDFDEIYRAARDAGKLPDLFDQLIRITSEIVNSGEIDSLVALEGLQQILTLLKANRDGSYLAAKQSISLAKYLKNLLSVYLEKLPGIKEHREAYDRTIREAETEMENVEQHMRDETLQAIRQRLPKLNSINVTTNTAILLQASFDPQIDCANHGATRLREDGN